MSVQPARSGPGTAPAGTLAVLLSLVDSKPLLHRYNTWSPVLLHIELKGCMCRSVLCTKW